jgi:hypothetical protein
MNDVPAGIWAGSIVILILVVWVTVWVTNKAYSRRWEDSDSENR